MTSQKSIKISLKDRCRVNPISRSEAKLVTQGISPLTRIEIDFSGIDEVGPSFADELLRVWPLKTGQVVRVVGCSDEVLKMVRHALSRPDLPLPGAVEIIDRRLKR